MGEALATSRGIMCRVPEEYFLYRKDVSKGAAQSTLRSLTAPFETGHFVSFLRDAVLNSLCE